MHETYLSRHRQFHLAIVHEQSMADFRCLNNLRMREHNTLIVPLGLIEIETENLTLFKHLSSFRGKLSDLMAMAWTRRYVKFEKD